MNFLLKEGKINWKYIIIVLILAIIVGGGILWCTTKQELSLSQLPEIKKPEEIAEKTCEELSGKEKDECYFDLAKMNKNLEFCEKIQSYVIISECKTEVKILKFIEKGPISLNIVNSDEELKGYLIENLIAIIDIDGELKSRIDPFNSCKVYFARGNFDEDPYREIVIAFECGSGPAGSGIIKEKEDGFYLTYWDTSGWRIYEKKLYDLQIVKDQPRLIIMESTSHAGTGMWDTTISILTMEKSEGLFENELKIIWSGISTSIDDQIWYRHHTEINTEFRDLDNDGNLEIIREGYEKSEEEFNEETGEFEKIREERIHQVLKWDEQKQGFTEEITE